VQCKARRLGACSTTQNLDLESLQRSDTRFKCNARKLPRFVRQERGASNLTTLFERAYSATTTCSNSTMLIKLSNSALCFGKSSVRAE
jgi:hypothetical protein